MAMDLTRPSWRRPTWYAICSLFGALFLAPIFWSILTSLKVPPEANAAPPQFLPSQLSLQNYIALLGYGEGMFHYFGNSLTVAALTVVGVLVLSVLAGFGFSRFKFPLKSSLFLLLLVTLMVPFQSILTPLFLVLRALNLQNSLVGLALVNTTFQLPFSVFMLRNSFDSIPRELDDAAAIDGCSSRRLLWRVLLPVALPGLVSVALFAFLASWNEFLAALIFLTDSNKFTLPVMLLNAQSGYLGTIDWGLMQAGITVTILPCAILFLLLQRYYVNGLISGAMK
jgi:multiple sugar transport system permease protein